MIATFALSLQDDNTGIPVNAKNKSAKLSLNPGYGPPPSDLSMGALA
jgi:hypothetical protein